MNRVLPSCLPGRTRSDSGFTLVELMVAMAMTVIISIAALGAVASFLSTDNTANQRLQTTAQAQLFLDRVTKELRAAVATGDPTAAVQYADPNHITFYTGATTFESGIGPRLVDMALVGGVLTEKVIAADPITPTGYTWNGAATTITTATVDATHGNLFTYYAAGANPTDPAATALTTPMNQSSLNPSTSSTTIDSVRVDLWLKRSASSPASKSTEVNSSIHLRNVDYAQIPY